MNCSTAYQSIGDQCRGADRAFGRRFMEFRAVNRQSVSNQVLVTEGSRNLPLAGLSKATLDLHAINLWMVSAKPEGQTWRGEKLGLLRQQRSFFRSPSTISEFRNYHFRDEGEELASSSSDLALRTDRSFQSSVASLTADLNHQFRAVDRLLFSYQLSNIPARLRRG